MAAAVLCIAACSPKEEQKVMARYVPERFDDFVWENEYVCYRAYGKALEGNPTAPGFDVWCKVPGKLVANERYHLELDEGISYHIDHGNGKDCYKVAVSLGGGASSPLVNGKLCYPATNWRSYEILSEGPKKVVFVLHYPEWDVNGHKVALDKKITVESGTYFCKAEDIYKGDFETMTIAAGIFEHEAEAEYIGEGRFALWEKASDTSIEPEVEGRIGVALYMPGAEKTMRLAANQPHVVCTKTVRPGESLTYYFASCWSKGEMTNSADWFAYVKGFTE